MLVRTALLAIIQLWLMDIAVAQVAGAVPQITTLNVQCDRTGMRVNVNFDSAFNGIIFSKGHYSDLGCRYMAPNAAVTTADFAIPVDKCGTNTLDIDGEDGMPPKRGFENILVFQNDPTYQEVFDHARMVVCRYTLEDDFDLKEKRVVFRPVVIDMLDVVSIPVRDADGLQSRVDCWMEITKGRFPQTSPIDSAVKVGSPLTLAIFVRDPRKRTDLRVKDCYAYDDPQVAESNGPALLQLTDFDGCPTKPKLIEVWKRTHDAGPTGATIIAFTTVTAFKFPDRPDLQLTCNIELCRNQCAQRCSSELPGPVNIGSWTGTAIEDGNGGDGTAVAVPSGTTPSTPTQSTDTEEEDSGNEAPAEGGDDGEEEASSTAAPAETESGSDGESDSGSDSDSSSESDSESSSESSSESDSESSSESDSESSSESDSESSSESDSDSGSDSSSESDSGSEAETKSDSDSESEEATTEAPSGGAEESEGDDDSETPSSTEAPAEAEGESENEADSEDSGDSESEETKEEEPKEEDTASEDTETEAKAEEPEESDTNTDEEASNEEDDSDDEEAAESKAKIQATPTKSAKNKSKPTTTTTTTTTTPPTTTTTKRAKTTKNAKSTKSSKSKAKTKTTTPKPKSPKSAAQVRPNDAINSIVEQVHWSTSTLRPLRELMDFTPKTQTKSKKNSKKTITTTSTTTTTTTTTPSPPTKSSKKSKKSSNKKSSATTTTAKPANQVRKARAPSALHPDEFPHLHLAEDSKRVLPTRRPNPFFKPQSMLQIKSTTTSAPFAANISTIVITEAISVNSSSLSTIRPQIQRLRYRNFNANPEGRLSTVPQTSRNENPLLSRKQTTRSGDILENSEFDAFSQFRGFQAMRIKPNHRVVRSVDLSNIDPNSKQVIFFHTRIHSAIQVI